MSAAHTATTTFLLVEDDVDEIYLVEFELKNLLTNLRIKSVTNGWEAQQYLLGEGNYSNRAEFPLPDVILLDLEMPRCNGFDFLKWLHSPPAANLATIPVVIISASKKPQDVSRSYELGANSYLVKPIGWPDFQKRLRAMGTYWVEHVENPHPRA